MTLLGSKRPREDDNNEAYRPRKRPGGASRVSKSETEAVLLRQQQRAEEARQAATTRGVEEVVRQHYNAVPQRGRDWRKTDSRIKGLRSFNNWIKSTIIHKFSPAEAGTESLPLRVLDIGCGKGGDLGKWQQAPQPLELYVGVDPAEVSIEQARERYTQMRSGGRGGRGGSGGYHGGRPQRTFDAEFFAEDAFAYSLGDIPLIREVGFGPGSRWGPAGGFDVVSMMFCMHYAFENEVKAKGMLANVAGSLKKGGRFIGVIPNSDVIRSGVEAFHARRSKNAAGKPQNESNGKPEGGNRDEARATGSESPPYIIGGQANSPPIEPTPSDKANGEAPARPTKGQETSEAAPGVTPAINVLTEPPSEANGTSEKRKTDMPSTKEGSLDFNPQVPDSKDDQPAAPAVAEWGNSIYRVRFPGDTPKDGIFRPPYGWKYSFFMEEAVEEVPEYVVPWEAFRAYVPLSSPRKILLTWLRSYSIAEDYNLELQYRKSFAEIWKEENSSPVFGPLSERMGVRGRDAGPLLVSDEEMEAASACFQSLHMVFSTNKSQVSTMHSASTRSSILKRSTLAFGDNV